jgi:hypothetical protein
MRRDGHCTTAVSAVPQKKHYVHCRELYGIIWAKSWLFHAVLPVVSFAQIV